VEYVAQQPQDEQNKADGQRNMDQAPQAAEKYNEDQPDNKYNDADCE